VLGAGVRSCASAEEMKNIARPKRVIFLSIVSFWAKVRYFWFQLNR
jgi:hypothetical protein